MKVADWPNEEAVTKVAEVIAKTIRDANWRGTPWRNLSERQRLAEADAHRHVARAIFGAGLVLPQKPRDCGAECEGLDVACDQPDGHGGPHVGSITIHTEWDVEL